MVVLFLVNLELQLTSEVISKTCLTAVYEQCRSLGRYMCAYLTVFNSIVLSMMEIFS